MTLSLTFWRPQRRPIQGEPGYSEPPTAWTDIGGLRYEVQIAGGGSHCPRSAFSEHDPKLTMPASPDTFGFLIDGAADQSASATNTFSYTLDLSACLRAPTQGIHRPPPAPISFDPGDARGFLFQALSKDLTGEGGGVGSASQEVWFKRQ